MHRFLAGLIIATAFHILILVVPISFLPDSRAHLPKTKSIKVGFNRIVPPAPKAEFTPIAPPPETIPLLAKRMVHPPPKKTPPPKPRPKPKKRFKPKAKPVMAKKKPLPKKEAVSKPEKSVPAPAIIPYRWEPPTYPAKSAPAKKTPIATASRVRETPPPLKIIEAVPKNEGNPPPKYPILARRRGWQGTVQLAVLVMADGQVGKVSIVKSSGYPLLDETARKAVVAYQFVPGKKGGQAVDMEVQVPVHFRLNDAE